MRPGRLVHERHELVRKARHRARDADSADIRTPTNPAHPTAFGHVAVHHGPPAADLYQALRRAIFVCEIALLIIAPAIATLVHGLSEQPRRTKLVVEWNDRS